MKDVEISSNGTWQARYYGLSEAEALSLKSYKEIKECQIAWNRTDTAKWRFTYEYGQTSISEMMIGVLFHLRKSDVIKIMNGV